MLSVWELIVLALGEEEAGHVDTALPQGFVDNQTPSQRDDNAGWYYERFGERRQILGRRLSQSECWERIRQRLESGELSAAGMTGTDVLDIAYVVKDWPCLGTHVTKGHLQLMTKAKFQELQSEVEERRQRLLARASNA